MPVERAIRRTNNAVAVIGREFIVENICLEHPEYKVKREMWRKYRDLYAGGEQLKANAADYLTARQKEPPEVYSERLSKVFYENYIGSIIDWYAATLFRREPVINTEGDDAAGREFFNMFAEDCDLKGTNISDFYRRQLIDTLIAGVSFALLDFPRTADRPKNRAEEDASGAARAYLVEYPAESLINWSLDSRGNYEWIVLRSTNARKDDANDAEYRTETIWRYYDKTSYRILRCTDAKKGDIQEIGRGFHALANQQRVPLFETRVTEGLWLMNKAALLQLEHFNKSNALSWALSMGLFAAPVVYSDKELNQVVGESYYIQLGPNDRFGWTEPEGHVHQIASENLMRLREEIYRVCYLMAQSHGSESSAAAQSGLSKLRDFAITQEVLRAYGDAVKDTLKRVLRAVSAARQDAVQVHVSGLDDFDIRDFSSDLEDAERLLGLNIQSPTLQKQVFKRLAYKYLCDIRQEVKDQIAKEIDASFEAR
jgi:hypothetical protein